MSETFSSRTPQQALAALLAQHTPQNLLLIGADQLPALQAFLAAHPECRCAHAPAGKLPAELSAQRFDLAIFVDCLEHLDKRSGLELLAGVRNLNASKLAVLVDITACDWQLSDFYALALQASEQFQRDTQTLTLFTYDLREYKQVPDWLNAKFWANPQLFGKYWW
jgi:DNA-binding transcriptional LysR family regulator